MQDYKSAGVDIDAGNQLVQLIKPFTKATKQPWANGALGGFGGIIDVKAVGMRDPLILLANDGVGTKLKLAIQHHYHQMIGIDLVAMCVNDLIVQGAKPLAFLDYYACGKLNVDQAKTIIQSIAEGCMQAGATLVGGETAEMPGMYQDQDYDLAGFAMGAVERDHLIENAQMRAGDCLIGLASSGFHSNGYSLIRKILDKHKIDLYSPPPFAVNYDKEDDETPRLIDLLMAPTRIYVTPIMDLLAFNRHAIHGICHITGGGFYENIPRILPDHLCANIDKQAWHDMPIFDWLADLGGIEPREMYRSFNCGIGMVIAVAADHLDSVVTHLHSKGEKAYRIGHVQKKTDQHNDVMISDIDY